MSKVTIKNLVKHYGPVVAVDQISVDIAEGEFFSLLGPSGCGKSTTLRMLAGFEEVSSGEISLDGEDVAPLPPEQRGIGFVFQNYAIFPHMNVFENIAFGLRLRKIPPVEIQDRVAAALKQVGMTGLETRMQSQMSGGQQQRVALARVLVTEPKILLLDEPLSALDKNLREEMKFWIKDLQTSLGITTIYVTHDQGEALTMSDRIGVMQNGKIAQVGSPRDIYETPANLFVAEFIGESSVLSGIVTDVGEAHCTLQIDATTVRASTNAALTPGDSGRIVLRPEQVIFGEAPKESAWNSVTATVTSINYQGATLRYTLQVAGQTLISESPNSPDVPSISTGEELIISWRVSAARALPGES